MQFKSAASISQIVMQMKIADVPRSQNRALVDMLFNGEPPYTPKEAEANRIDVNVNFLEGTNLAHNARQQFSRAFLSSSRFFTVKLDSGPAYKRTERSEIITSEINRIMKRSRVYKETLRNVFGNVVLHGVSPATWDSCEGWKPSMQMLCDVLMPSKTLRTLENVEYFSVYRRYTPARLWRMTHGPAVDSGWNVPLAEKCCQWARAQYGKSTPSGNDQMYSPERLAEDMKSDNGLYASDAVPTIDCWDFYFLNDDGTSWNRRIVLDVPTAGEGMSAGDPIVTDGKNQYLYDSGDRAYASKIDELAHFQFADGNQVAPFRYHSVRSLGWLLYAVCHLQNRIRCKLNEHAFENMMQYFRTSNPADMERLQKIDLINFGIIPDGLQMVPQTERWQINAQVPEMVIGMNRQSMAANSASYTQDYERQQQSNDKTATEVMAEVNASSALVGAMLNDAYDYQEFQYLEIARRFCIKNSSDPDVKDFRAACLRQNVPLEMLDSTRWIVSADRVMGGGNKQLEVAQGKALMEIYPRLSPGAQQVVMRNYVFAVTSDAALTDQIVPAAPERVTPTVHDAQLAAGALMQGLPVAPRPGFNNIEYIETLLGTIGAVMKAIEENGGNANQEQVSGIMNVMQSVQQHIDMLAQDETEKPRVKQYQDDLSKIGNVVKGYQQRLAEQQQAQGAEQQSEGQAKVELMKQTAQTKLEIDRAKANQKMEQAKEKHELQMANQIRSTQVQEASTDIKTAAEIRRDGLKASTGAETTVAE